MKCVDLRCASELLAWLRAAALGVSAASCTWVPARDWTVVEAAPREDPKYKAQARLFKPDLCASACTAYPNAHCSVATLVGSDNPQPAREHQVVVCDYHEHGHLEQSLSFVPTPFGRVSAAQLVSRQIAASEAEYFFGCARDEAASVYAFRQLAFDLEALDAPLHLIVGARSAAQDEARHARWALRLARRRGLDANVKLPRMARPERRVPELLSLALDNAVTGCAAETFGAWLQLVQARNAHDPGLRQIAERVARDEAGHAALAFALFDWFESRLSKALQSYVRIAMSSAFSRMAESVSLLDRLRPALGIPSRAELEHQARALAGALVRPG